MDRRHQSNSALLQRLFPRVTIKTWQKPETALENSLAPRVQTTRIQKQFPLSVFVFIDSLVVSGLQDARGYAISRQNNYELHLGCHICLLSYFKLVWMWCGRTVRQAYGHVITKFSQRGRHAVLHFLSHGAPWPALRTRELHNNAWATCTDFKLL